MEGIRAENHIRLQRLAVALLGRSRSIPRSATDHLKRPSRPRHSDRHHNPSHGPSELLQIRIKSWNTRGIPRPPGWLMTAWGLPIDGAAVGK